MPLTFLTAVDKSRITRVEFLFDQRSSGSLLISDLHFYKTQAGEVFPVSNVALQATATASSQNVNTGQTANKAIDGVVDGYQGTPGDSTKEWASNFQGAGAWLRLDWSALRRVKQILLFDRPNLTDQVLSGTLSFSDGTSISVGTLNNAGAPMIISFPEKTITWMTFTINSANYFNSGLAEIQVFGFQ